jgi:FixJ family two-component response regulator
MVAWLLPNLRRKAYRSQAKDKAQARSLAELVTMIECLRTQSRASALK